MCVSLGGGVTNNLTSLTAYFGLKVTKKRILFSYCFEANAAEALKFGNKRRGRLQFSFLIL